MNIYTNMISEITGKSLAESEIIQNYIDENISIDWSEASLRAIKNASVLAQREMLSAWNVFGADQKADL